MKRMTAAQPFQAEPDTPRDAMHFDSFAHIVRAGRVIAAGGRQQRRNQTFVPGEEEDGDGRGDRRKKRRTSA